MSSAYPTPDRAEAASSSSISSSPSPSSYSSNSKPLWIAIGALVVVVAAMGGVMIGQSRGGASSAPNEPAKVAAMAPNGPASALAPNDGVPPPVTASAASPAPTPTPPTEPVRAPVAALSSPNQASNASGNAPAPASAPVAQAAPAKPPCATCGRVESVHTVQREQPTTGVGAVAGGVAGGVLGNQIGHGNGRTAATVLGAVGGGFLGNTIEKRTRTVTRYQVAVRMEDGRLRTVETSTAPPIGKAVTLKGNVLRPADQRL